MGIGVGTELICERFSGGLAWKRGDPFLPPHLCRLRSPLRWGERLMYKLSPGLVLFD